MFMVRCDIIGQNLRDLEIYDSMTVNYTPNKFNRKVRRIVCQFFIGFSMVVSTETIQSCGLLASLACNNCKHQHQ